MSPKVGVRDVRKNQLARAAFKCIAKNGFHQTTVHDISIEAGFSKGLIIYYFDSKEALLLSVMERFSSKQEKFLEDYFGLEYDHNNEEAFYSGLSEYVATCNIANLLEEIVKAISDFFFCGPETSRVWLEFWAQTARNSRVRQLNDIIMTRIKRILEIILIEEMRRKRLDTSDASKASEEILTHILGSAIYHNNFTEYDPSLTV